MAGVDRTATRILGFTSPEMDFQLMRQLGAANAGGGAPGEIFAARGSIDGDDPYAWPPAFAAQAERLETMADAALAAGHTVSASQHLLRASSYYRSAEYFSDPFKPEGLVFGNKSRNTFVKAAPLLPHHIEAIGIPFDGLELPGYFMAPAGGARDGRTVIAMTGFDGTGEELYFQTAADGLARGFNVLVAEGPGQVGALRRYPERPFQPDYEAPIGAIVDYALTRSDVNADKLALYGISFGGYFVTRGAAHDDRLKALIANSPIVDLLAYMSAFVSAGDDADDSNEDQDVSLDEVDEVPDDLMPPAVKLGFKSACRRFAVTSFSGWFEALAAYTVTDDLHRITCPSLAMVGVGEGDEALRQAEVFRTSVAGPVTLRTFDVDDGADMHCQLGNLPLSNAVIYDWLSDTLG